MSKKGKEILKEKDQAEITRLWRKCEDSMLKGLGGEDKEVREKVPVAKISCVLTATGSCWQEYHWQQC